MADKPAETENFFSSAVVVGVVAFLLQFVVVNGFSHSPEFLPHGDDMQFYSDWARRIAHGQWTDGHAFYGLPGYAYLLAGIFTLIGFDPFTIGLIQALLFALCAGLLVKLAPLAFPKRAESDPSPELIGVLAGLGWALFIPAQTFAAVMMPTVWLVLIYWGCVYWILRHRTGAPLLSWLLLGLSMGLTAMVVATILMLIPLVVAGIYWSCSALTGIKARLQRMGAAAALFTIGIFTGIAPAALHNHLIAHEPVMLSAHSGINFWIGNNPGATGYPKMPPGIRASQAESLKDSINVAQAAMGRELTRAEVSKYWSEQANAFIREHPAQWLQLLGKKFVNFWNAYQYDDISTIELLHEEGVTTPGLRFGGIAAFGLAGMLLASIWIPSARWLSGAILLHLLALLPVFLTERYRLAAVPGLLLFGAWWIVAFWNGLVFGQWRRLLAFVPIALAAAWFVSIPRADASLWSLDLYKAGIRATDAKDYERAQQKLTQALSYSPQSAEIYFALGNLALAREEPNRAKLLYRSALQLNPRHARVLNNLGILALDEKQWGAAENLFQAAIGAEPDDAKTYYLLARARRERGNLSGAREAIASALKLRPEEAAFLSLQAQLEEKR